MIVPRHLALFPQSHYVHCQPPTGVTGGEHRFYIRPSVCMSVRLTVGPQNFPDISAMWAAIALTLCAWFYVYDLQIEFEDGCYQPIFGRVMPLELSHFNGFYSFPHFFSLCLQIFILYLVRCFTIRRYRSSLSLVWIHQFSPKLWPLHLEKYHKLSVSALFSLCL
jgi:hypothetical protein